MQHIRTRRNFCNTNQYFSDIDLHSIKKYAYLRHVYLNVNNYNCRISQYEARNMIFSSVLSNIIVEMIEKCITLHVIILNIFKKNRNKGKISKYFPIFMLCFNIYSTKIMECF